MDNEIEKKKYIDYLIIFISILGIIIGFLVKKLFWHSLYIEVNLVYIEIPNLSAIFILYAAPVVGLFISFEILILIDKHINQKYKLLKKTIQLLILAFKEIIENFKDFKNGPQKISNIIFFLYHLGVANGILIVDMFIKN